MSVKTYSLKEFTSSIKRMFDQHYSNFYWIRAEMHKLNFYPSGHCFPELVQKEDGKIVAQISGTIWKTNYQTINQKFIEIVKEPISEGANLLLQVKVVYNEVYGLSLIINDIDPSFSLGELQREKQETIEKLGKLDIIDKNQKHTFPLLPKRIAIISAESSKGLSDFYDVLKNNGFAYHFDTYLFPAYLQGDNAVFSIIQALTKIKKASENFDLVVIVRGGGAEVGMSCYNNFDLCKEIALFPLPVLTGIGHSTNLTVAEMVAYRNAITPTQLAEILIQGFHNYIEPIRELTRKIPHYVKNRLQNDKVFIKNLSDKFLSNSMYQLSYADKSLTEKIRDFDRSLKLIIKNERTMLQEHSKNIKRNIPTILKENKKLMAEKAKEFFFLTQKSTEMAMLIIEILQKTIEANDPFEILKKGYTMSLFEGKVISQKNQPKKGDEIVTKGHNFQLKSVVQNEK